MAVQYNSLIRARRFKTGQNGAEQPSLLTSCPRKRATTRAMAEAIRRCELQRESVKAERKTHTHIQDTHTGIHTHTLQCICEGHVMEGRKGGKKILCECMTLQ